MARNKVTVVFNYRSPFCALVVDRLFNLASQYTVALEWRIVADVPRPSSLPITQSNPRFIYNREDCARRARWLGLPWMPPSWRLTDVVAASRLGQFLLETDRSLFRSFTMLTGRAYWSHGRNISDPSVVVDVARLVGVSEAQLREAETQQAELDRKLDANKRWCDDDGVLGVPYFVLDDQRFWGSDRIGALERCLAEQGAGPLQVAGDGGVLFADSVVPTLPIAGKEERVAVRRIFCVGRNYADHAREMGNDPARDPPFFFMKSTDAVVLSGEDIPYPAATKNFHFEMELVAILGKPVFNASTSAAADAIYGYAAGLDMTRRDLQLDARSKGHPWELGKSFESSAVIGAIRCASDLAEPPRGPITLTVNGVTRQSATIADMIWSVPEIVATLSRFHRLREGDVIFTGTPAGVGPVQPGDTLRGEVEGIGEVCTTITQRSIGG